MQITGKQAWVFEDSASSAPGSGKFAANGAFSDNLAFADRYKERSFIDSITSGIAHSERQGGHFGGYVACALLDALGTSPALWIDLQTQYDLWQASRKRRPRIELFDRVA